MKQMRALLLAIAWVGGVLAPAAAAPDQRIVAVVNDDVISARDLDDRLRLVMFTSQINDSEQARARLAPQVLRGLIEETLQIQEAERLDMVVEEAEIQEALQNIAERNQMTVDAMTRMFAGNGISLDTLRRQVRAQIGWVRVVNRQIVPRVTVTVDQLDLAVDEARRNEGQPEYLLSEIVLPVDNPNQAEVVAQDAARLVQTLREGASFDSLARQVSVAASAERGGDLGWMQGATLPPELRDALERLRTGEVSDPLPSAVGFHIFWLRDRRTGRPPVDSSQAAVEVALAQILLPVNGQADVSAVRARAEELRGRLVDCPAIVEVANELGTPASGDLGWLRIGDLPSQLGQTILNLPVGEVSPPLEGPSEIRLLMVCDRRDPAEATGEREQIGERLQRERVERLARRYLRDLRKEAFVEVRL